MEKNHLTKVHAHAQLTNKMHLSTLKIKELSSLNEMPTKEPEQISVVKFQQNPT